ncbi:Na+/H+ antiporter subunit E [Embleya scabrispora]|uniref:Na+/H+ antiporter subunit E n=1 Tax=Embleya scabrispora TaxID=159449 RepID=UPI00036BA42F|nr:Na+/H+ antiporter subunit E [Embleya scabrispora]MYS83573.1 Na+/H+ antiporter subunit E [Streptomyces sp. SID5474]
MTVGRIRSRTRRVLPLPVGWLTVVWVALWGTLTIANVLTGLVVAVLLQVLLPLPPAPGRLVFRPFGLVRFVVRFALDLVVSSLRVAWQALWPGRLPRSSVVGVALATRSDVLLTLTVLALNVIPGSIVVEIRRGRPTMLFIHALGADTPASVEAARRAVVRLEARVVAAFGTREERAVSTGTSGGGR